MNATERITLMSRWTVLQLVLVILGILIAAFGWPSPWLTAVGAFAAGHSFAYFIVQCDLSHYRITKIE